MKRCSKCHKLKDMSNFYHDKNRGDGYSTKCKECDYTSRKHRREKLKARTKRQIPKTLKKICSRCGLNKAVSDFYPERRNVDGYSSWCKSCYLNHSKSYRKKLTERPRKNIPKITSKKCPKCKKTKPVSEFYKASSKLDGYSTICKECNSKSSVKYRERIANREFKEIQVSGKKRCWMCKRFLPATNFNFSRQSKDGLSSLCRECNIKYKQQHYNENKGEYDYRSSAYKSAHKLRYRAYSIVYDAINKGELYRPSTCSKCGRIGKIVAHHEDYLKALDVIWLCLSCDRQLHANRRKR